MSENGNTGEEISLKYERKGQVAKSGLLGVFIGLAIIIPGVSGAAVCSTPLAICLRSSENAFYSFCR